MRSSLHWAAALLLVTCGALASPSYVPVYDGVGLPDEPYRYVAPPPGARPTRPATAATATTPVADGVSANGLSLTSAETGPQVSLFLPAGAFASASGTVTVRATPVAPVGLPVGLRPDGNAVEVVVSNPSAPVTITPRAALASLSLRATTGVKPGPVLEYAPSPRGRYRALATSQAGQDAYVAAFVGPGRYVLAFGTAHAAAGRSPLPIVLGGLVLVLALVIAVVRLRAGRGGSPQV